MYFKEEVGSCVQSGGGVSRLAVGAECASISAVCIGVVIADSCVCCTQRVCQVLI